MRPKTNSPSSAAQDFVQLRDSILAEREKLIERLRQIDSALAGENRPWAVPARKANAVAANPK